MALHWLIGITIILLVAMGLYMSNTETLTLYSIHKSLGLSVAIFIVLRVVWRIAQGWPEPASQYQRWEQVLSKIVHWGLMLVSIMFPVTGFMLSWMGGWEIALWGWEIIPMTPDPEKPGYALPLNEGAAKGAAKGHEVMGDLFLILISLHVAGALKHHVVDKDKTLKRMLGR